MRINIGRRWLPKRGATSAARLTPAAADIKQPSGFSASGRSDVPSGAVVAIRPRLAELVEASVLVPSQLGSDS